MCVWHRFSLGFSITVLLDPEREMFDGSVLLMVETVALSLACALATYCITFSLLEFYYVHLVVGAAGLDEAAGRASRSAQIIFALSARCTT